jgi:selenocysteine lyase/cysteine desulfurase
MDITANDPAPNARRFEAGTPPVVNCYAAEAGLRLLLRVGAPAIEQRIAALTHRCMLQLAEIGWPSVTPTPNERRGAMVALPSRDGGRLTAELMKRDIVTSHRDANARASFHFYNNEDDVDAFVAAAKGLRDAFAPRAQASA